MQLVFGSLALLILVGGTIFGVVVCSLIALRFLIEGFQRLWAASWFIWIAILAAIVVIVLH